MEDFTIRMGFGMGGPELMYVLIIVLVLFGGAKIPQMMRGLGEGMREFKKATREDEDTPALPEAKPKTAE